MSVPVYWWRGIANFGDELGSLVFEKFCGHKVSWASPAESQVVVCGSVIEHLPEEWEGTVLGAGTLFPDSGKLIPWADIRAVRGPLTAAMLSRGDVALGDPGLLASELVPPQVRDIPLGVIPHWSDRVLDLRPEFRYPGRKVINVSRPALEVVRDIARCKKVVSSSLHGIILADAFGIPRRTELAPQMILEGGAHKFADHAAAVGIPLVIGKVQQPLYARVEDRMHELYDVLKGYGAELRE